MDFIGKAKQSFGDVVPLDSQAGVVGKELSIHGETK